MSKAHTPTPWGIYRSQSIGDLSGRTHDIVIMPTNERKSQHIAKCWSRKDVGHNGGVSEEEGNANADLIITAVNHHHELVTRLQDCVDRMDKCRNILQKTAGNHAGNWGILDTSEARETLKKVIP